MWTLSINNGTLYYTTDINMAFREAEVERSRVLLIDDINETFENPRIIRAGILLPPYDAMCAYEEGDNLTFISIYEQHIVSNCSKIICSIIMAMINGTNILMYIPEHIYNEVSYLLGYILRTHGITCGNQCITSGYNPAFNNVNAEYLYRMRYIDAETFLYTISGYEFVNNPVIMNMLVADINPYIGKINSFGDYANYFMNYKNQMQSLNTILYPAITNKS